MMNPRNGLALSLLAIFAVTNIPAALTGFACMSNPCVHGICLDDINSTFLCYCIDGYTGIHCQTNWNECWSNPCQNGGECVDGIASYNCSCPQGFGGDRCEYDLNECESNPCLNNGTCLDEVNGYVCSCLAGYVGIHCEIDVAVCNSTNETRCFNGGSCVEGPADSFSCICQPGWEDELCQTEINECLQNPCQNGAVCLDLLADYFCACSFGFIGKNCEEELQLCPINKCKNGALCLLEDNHPVCYCVPDFHGNLCQFQYDECQLGARCENGGTCIDGVDNFTCSCPPYLTGVFCECLILSDGSQNCSVTDLDLSTVTYLPNSFNNITTISSREVTDIELVSTTFTFKTSTYLTSPFTTGFFTTESPFTETTTFEFTKKINFTDIIPLTSIFTTETNLETTTRPEYTEQTESTTFESSTSHKIPIEEEISTPVSHKSTMYAPTAITTEETDVHVSTNEPTTFVNNITQAVLVTSKPTTLESNETPFTSFPTESTSAKEITTTEQFASSKAKITELPTTYTALPTEREGHDITLPLDITSTTPSSTLKSTLTSPRHEIEETTTIQDYTTVTTNFDCTQEDQHCENDGTCILTSEGSNCLCPFDKEGQRCENSLGVKNAAFNGNSYLAHRLFNYTHINFEFEAKTLSQHGIIFYLFMEKIYMVLYVRNGYLEFKFSCGYQTMLLREVTFPVSLGYTMHIRAKLHFRPDFSHCDASVKINNTLSMMGDQILQIPKYTKPTTWLYFGGIPAELYVPDIVFNGFAGCMKNLKISGKAVNIFGDAEDGIAVTECSSIACLSNPCNNGATCVTKGENWECRCRTGFLGQTCESSVCDNNPCLYGGTCLSYSRSGYICLCPYGKHGHFCENDLSIQQPSFSPMVKGWSSYLTYSIPKEISKHIEIKFKFTPANMDQISLLLFIGQTGYHDVFSDHIAVSLIKGFVMLTWNLGSGPRRIFTNQPLKDGLKDYTVHVGFNGRRGWLFVENIGNITGRSPGSFEKFDVAPILFIGGHESRNFSLLPHDLPFHNGFIGCIFDIKLSVGNELIPLKYSIPITGRAVSQCGVSECYEQRCPNMGACLHHGSTFTCLCQDSWFGPQCLSKINPCDSQNHKCKNGATCVPLIEGYECDCPFGKIGKYCEQVVNITDISFNGKRSFIHLIPYAIENNKFNIKMEIKPLTDKGLLFFTGSADHFVSLSLQSGSLELRIKRGKNKISHNLTIIRSSRLLVQGVWHKIKFGMFGRRIYLVLENILNTGIMEKESFLHFQNDSIYLGGLPDLSTLPSDALSNFPTSYIGCIRFLDINSKNVPLDTTNIAYGKNLIDCDGTPCGGDVCQNGGTCWLDSFQESHCSCQSPFYGNKCEFIYNCTDSMCNNLGICKENKCHCVTGWNGAFCENEITVTMPKFNKGSYLIIDKSGDKRRETLYKDIRMVSINFTTASSDGLLLWHSEGNAYFGLGIEKSYLKVVYSTNESNSFSAILYNNKISDGLWHNVFIKFSPWFIKIDNKPFKKNQVHLKDLDILFTNGKFYLGNIPSKKGLLVETKGFFARPFEGCIDSFTKNLEKIVDFTMFEGLDVEVCSNFLDL